MTGWPEQEEPPERIDEELAKRRGPSLADRDQLRPRNRGYRIGGILFDPGEFAGGHARVFARVAVPDPPGAQPGDPQQARNITSHTPVERWDDSTHQQRGVDRPDHGAGVEYNAR